MQGNSTIVGAEWETFLTKSNAASKRADLHHGLAFTPRPGDSPRETVQAYIDGFGWGSGVSRADIVEATGLSMASVRRITKAIVDDGLATVTYSLTRGKSASRRERYQSLERKGVVIGIQDATIPVRVEYTCGGGRHVNRRVAL